MSHGRGRDDAEAGPGAGELERRVAELEAEAAAREARVASLVQSERRLRAIFEAAHDVAFVVADLGGAEARVLECSAGAERLFGWSRQELIGQPVARLHLPEDVARFGEAQAAMAEGRAGFSGVSTLVRRSGERFPAAFTTYPVLDEEGRMTAALGVSFDVGERQAFEERLAESEAFLQSVFDAIQDGISILDRDLRIVRVNAWMERMYSHAAPLSGKRCHEAYHAGRGGVCEPCPSVRAFALGVRQSDVVPYTTPEGIKGWLDLSAFPLKDESGEVVRVIEYVKDVSDLHRAEQHLRLQLDLALGLGRTAHLDEALGLLVDGVRELEGVDAAAIYLVDEPTGDLVLVAHRGLSDGFVARTERMPAGTELRALLDAAENRFGAVGGEVPDEEGRAEGLRAAGLLPLRYRGRPVGTLNVASRSAAELPPATRRLLSGIAAQVAGLVARIRFEEERLALEAKVQQAQKLESLGVLAGGIAHDFNNLLVGILGNADLALLDLPPESPARQSVRDIEVAARRATELVRQMLAYSGKGRFVVEPLDLGLVVEEMLHLLEASVSKKAHLRLDLAPGLPRVEGDATQLRQVLMNLILNASDAIGDRSGVVSVRTGAMRCDRAYLDGSFMASDAPAGPYVFVEVSDTGVGMERATIERIFDPFFSTKFTGRGLGLAAVLGIVRSHRGAIKVRSELGRGTTVRVLLPPAADERVAGSALQGETARAPTARAGVVLLVDDEETVRAVGRAMLARLGFEVVAARDGREAVEVFASDPRRFACVLLDLTMPRMDGDECFRRLRELRPEVRVVLSSGYNEQELLARFAGKGLAGFIQKPYHIDELAAALDRVLGDAEPGR